MSHRFRHTGPMVHSILHSSQFNAVSAASDTKSPVWDAAIRGHQRTQQTKRVDAIRQGQAQRQAAKANKPKTGSASPKMTEGAGPIHPTLSPQPSSGRHAGGEAASNPGYVPKHGAKTPTPAPAVPVARKANAGARAYTPPPTWRQERSPGLLDFSGSSNAGPSPVRAVAKPSQTSMDLRKVAPHAAPMNPRAPIAADPEGRPEDFGSAFQSHPVPWDGQNPSGTVVNHKQAMFAGTGIPTPKGLAGQQGRARAANDLRLAQHAQGLRAEAATGGYKTETGQYFGEKEGPSGSHKETRLTKKSVASESDAAQKHAWEEQKRSGQ